MLQLSIFKAFSISYFALQALGLSLFLLVAQCFRHGSLFCPSSNFIRFAFLMLHYTSFATLLRFIPHNSVHSFQPLSVHRLPTFQLACIVVRASCVFVFSCNKKLQQKCPCVAIVWHAFLPSPSGGNVGGLLPHLQHSLHPLSYLKLPCCTPSLHSQVARRTTDCKSFISFVAPCRMHLSSFIFCNRFPNARSRLFYPSRSN